MGTYIFVDQHLFLDKTSLDPNIFCTQNFSLSGNNFFLDVNTFFCTRNLVDQTFRSSKFFGPHCFVPKIFWTKNLFWIQKILTQIFLAQIFFTKIFLTTLTTTTAKTLMGFDTIEINLVKLKKEYFQKFSEFSLGKQKL